MFGTAWHLSLAVAAKAHLTDLQNISLYLLINSKSNANSHSWKPVQIKQVVFVNAFSIHRLSASSATCNVVPGFQFRFFKGSSLFEYFSKTGTVHFYLVTTHNKTMGSQSYEETERHISPPLTKQQSDELSISGGREGQFCLDSQGIWTAGCLGKSWGPFLYPLGPSASGLSGTNRLREKG